MTPEEYKTALAGLSEDEFAEFRRKFGGSGTDRDWYVRDFVDHPDHERRLCQLLGLKTEDEKRTEAAVTSAQAAAASAKSAHRSAVCATWGIVVSVLALLVAVLSLYIAGG